MELVTHTHAPMTREPERIWESKRDGGRRTGAEAEGKRRKAVEVEAAAKKGDIAGIKKHAFDELNGGTTLHGTTGHWDQRTIARGGLEWRQGGTRGRHVTRVLRRAPHQEVEAWRCLTLAGPNWSGLEIRRHRALV